MCDAFDYSIRRVEGGWAWCAYLDDGRPAARGIAPNKAAAAAFVIRHIARSLSPGSRCPAAPPLSRAA